MSIVKFHELTIIKSTDDYLAGSDCFCEINLNGSIFKTRKVKSLKTQTCIEWNEKFRIDIPPVDSKLKNKLNISLFENQKKIGQVKMELEKINLECSAPTWLELRDSSGAETKSKILLKMALIGRNSSKIGRKKNFLKVTEYFMVSDLYVPEEIASSSKYTKNFARLCYRFPAEDKEELPLDKLKDIYLFTFPSYFHYRESCTPPIVFHSTLTVNERRVYSSTLICYRRLAKKPSTKRLFEPVALTFLSRLPFLDEFSAILKYLYLTYFHDPAAKMDLKHPTPDFIKTIKFFCHDLPAPNSHNTIKVHMKSHNKDYSVSNKTKKRASHPVAIKGPDGIRVQDDIECVIVPRASRPSHVYKMLPSKNWLKESDSESSLHAPSSSEEDDDAEPKPRAKSADMTAANDSEDTHPLEYGFPEISGGEHEVHVTLSKDYEFYAFPQLSVNLYQNLFDVLDVHTVVKVLSCIMCEISTVFYSSQFSLLTKIQECFKALLFPFSWRHIYIPNLPKQLLHIIDAPVPFMIGLNSKYISIVKDVGIRNKALFIDIDSSSIEYHNNIPLFPQKEKRKLVEKLRRIFKQKIFEADSIFKRRHNKYSRKIQFDIRKTFLVFFSQILGDYRGFLEFSDGKVPRFKTATYIDKMCQRSIFFVCFLKTDMFSSFIQKHIVHPALLIDYIEYITRKGAMAAEKKKSVLEFRIPQDLNRLDEKKDLKDLGGRNVFQRDALLEKSNFEKAKPKDTNRINRFLESLFLREKTVNNGELASISELFKLIEWREYFLKEVIEWIKTPLTKQSLAATKTENKRLHWLQSLNKIKINKECFTDLSFIFHVLLTECEQSNSSADFRLAKTILDVSTIFYNKVSQKKSNSAESMEFLIKCLLAHPLLKNSEFWKSVLVYEAFLKYKDKEADSDWCFQRIVRYAHQMVDLNGLELEKIYGCIDYWCEFCSLSDENNETLKKTAKNLEASKKIRLSEYLHGGVFNNFEFVSRFGASKNNLVPEFRGVEFSRSVQSKEERISAKASRVQRGGKGAAA